MEHTITESAWQRARQDTISAQKKPSFMWGGEGVFAVAGGTWLAQIAPAGASIVEMILRSVIGGLGGLLAAVLVIFAWNLYRAPYKQRNESRNTLRDMQKPKPISNKGDLLRAISAFTESALVEFTHKDVMNEHSCKTCPLMEPSDFTQAYKALAAEKLVAGEKADKILSHFMTFVLEQMVAQYSDEPPLVGVLGTDEFIDKLRKMTNKTVKKIELLTR